MDRLLGPSDARDDRLRSWPLALMRVFGICRCRSVNSGDLPGITIVSIHKSEFGLADAHGVLQHSVEDRTQLARRTADDAQYLRCRGLLLQRLTEIGSTLVQLIEQPRVLDGNHGLCGEVLQQSNLFVGKGADFQAID